MDNKPDTLRLDYKAQHKLLVVGLKSIHQILDDQLQVEQ